MFGCDAFSKSVFGKLVLRVWLADFPLHIHVVRELEDGNQQQYIAGLIENHLQGPRPSARSDRKCCQIGAKPAWAARG